MNTGPPQQQTSNQTGGFLCPRCKNPIRFPLGALLTQPSIFCSSCGLELQIDPQGSATALDALRRYAAGMDDARRMLDESKKV
jgi:transcription elongation factor Elf1